MEMGGRIRRIEPIAAHREVNIGRSLVPSCIEVDLHDEG